MVENSSSVIGATVATRPNDTSPNIKTYAELPYCTSGYRENVNDLAEFEAAMNAETAGCDCLPSCQETVYETQVGTRGNGPIGLRQRQ